MRSNLQLAFLISIFIIVSLSITMLQCRRTSTKVGDAIIWSGTKEFKSISQSFKISPEEARELLYDKTRQIGGKESYYYNSLLFIVNNEYFFSEPHKEKTQLEGFYVNANTGEIKYKKSLVVMTKKLRYLPINAYSEVKLIE